MKKTATLLASVLCLFIFSGCSSSNNIETDFYAVPESTNLWYDSYTEVVGIRKNLNKSSGIINATYHNYQLYYCPHSETLYYYNENNEKIDISLEDIEHNHKSDE